VGGTAPREQKAENRKQKTENREAKKQKSGQPVRPVSPLFFEAVSIVSFSAN
jgi:hypothetical protein